MRFGLWSCGASIARWSPIRSSAVPSSSWTWRIRRAYEAQEPNDFFADGRTLRPPVPGTIARGYLPFPYGKEEAEAKRAGVELKNPFEISAELLARGERVYRSTCAACHGGGGLGDGAVTKRGVPPPPSLLADNAKKIADGEIYHIITQGRKNMPSHAAQVTREDRWKVIHYVRELQGGK